MLSTMTDLRSLSLEGCRLPCLPDLVSLQGLRFLDVTKSDELVDVSGVSAVGSLNVLDVMGCERLEDVSCLFGRHVHCKGCDRLRKGASEALRRLGGVKSISSVSA